MATLYAVSNLKLGKNEKGERVYFPAGAVVTGLSGEKVKELMALGSVSTRNPLADDVDAVAEAAESQAELEAARDRIAELEAALEAKTTNPPTGSPKA